MEFKDLVKGIGKFKIEKYRLREGETEEELLKRIDSGERQPYETKEFPDNIWLTTGFNELLKIIAGTSTSHFDGTNTQIGIGNDATAAAASQTDLIGGSKTYKTVDSGSPTTPASGQTTYKAKFLTSEANYTWYEVVIKNSVSGVCWNRKVLAGDTKTSAEVWYISGVIGAA